MHAMYETDLQNATEIVLSHRRVRPARPEPRHRPKGRGGRTSRAAAGALRIGNTFGAALTAKRPVGRSEAVTLLYGAGIALGISTVAFLWPKWLAIPVGVVIGWLGLAWAARAVKLLRDGRQDDDGA
jgi:cardiolipin synthase